MIWDTRILIIKRWTNNFGGILFQNKCQRNESGQKKKLKMKDNSLRTSRIMCLILRDSDPLFCYEKVLFIDFYLIWNRIQSYASEYLYRM